ncbi:MULTISPECIES: hypothetical protein [unclassified Novosphingobium]|uniref:hypothetical protein n=1 Tax=unclassified Novosphingobium TaxID=2644732 RepID=UPI000AB17432|nr:MULTISPECIES: hypothetical protein [unclassified Novosphingobium]MBN9146506.1 hypothetical protein [Novosphingobium sp.]MDR6710303.1 hypothetical protein [Novosphingobium sp. 1748]
MYKAKSLGSAMGAALALAVAAPAAAQSDPLEVIVPGEVPVQSTGKSAIIAGLAEAEQAALINAWIVIKRNPDVALKVRNLSVEQNNSLAHGLKSRCQSTMMNYEVDKKLKRLSARYRFNCNLLDVVTDIDAMIRTAPLAQNAPNRPRLATFFLVKEVATQTTYDPNIDRYAKGAESANSVQRDSMTANYNSDARQRTTSTEGYGEGRGAVSDRMSTRDQNKGRANASATQRSDASTTVEARLQANGRTINQAVDQKFRAVSPEELNATLTDVFKNGRAKINHYADVFSSCPGPDPDAVTREFGTKSEDLSTPVRTGILNALRKCNFRFVLLGDGVLDTTQPDPVTGSPQVSVVLRAKIWDISDNFPEVVASIQKTASASNPNLNMARSEAIFQASQRVGEEVLSRLSAEGIR